MDEALSCHARCCAQTRPAANAANRLTHSGQYSWNRRCHKRSPSGEILTIPLAGELSKVNRRVSSEGYNFNHVHASRKVTSWSELSAFY